MAFHDHLSHEITFQPFTDEQQLSQSRDMQRMLPLSGGGGAAPTWLNNAATLRQQNFLHLQPDHSTAQNDDVRGLMGTSEKNTDRNRTESNAESEDLAEYKADILGHPLYDQLLSAHVSCLRIATPVDQLPRIDAQLQQSQRVVDKYSGLGNGVVDEKELDQFMTHYVLLLCAFKEQLQQHVRVHAMEAVMACWELEQSLQSLTGTGVSPGEGTGATMSDDEEDQAESNANLYEASLDGADSLSFGPLVPTERLQGEDRGHKRRNSTEEKSREAPWGYHFPFKSMVAVTF
ncbi:hypothetical protein SESBI_02335 [Sesbania bispinosa]|nr:hypothetical protein SESBI_02335 [Sesbania bispinosa]